MTNAVAVRLVKIIERFPELYKSEHDLADDEAHSMVVWDTISYELGTPVEVLKKKWEELRSSHREKCRNLNRRKPPHDDVFHLMNSMLDASGGDSASSDRDDSSMHSTPPLSIISEGRSSRSSSTSTLVAEIGAENASKNPAELIGRKNTSTRILRSSRPRATRSAGSSEAAKDIPHRVDPSPKNPSNSNSRNGKKSSGRFANSRHNAPVKAFFESMALTVAKFPQHLQATTKTKICNIVVEAELELSPPATR